MRDAPAGLEGRNSMRPETCKRAEQAGLAPKQQCKQNSTTGPSGSKLLREVGGGPGGPTIGPAGARMEVLRKGQARLRSCAANGCRDQSSLPLLSVRARRCAANLSIKLERSRASPCAKLATHGRCSCGFLEPLTHVLAVSYPRMPLLLATVYSTQRLATEKRTRGRCARLDPFGNRQ